MRRFCVLLIIFFITLCVTFPTNARGIQPDTYKVVVTPNFFGTFEGVDVKVSAIKNNIPMPTFEGYITITVYDERGYILKPSEATLPNDGWLELTSDDHGEKEYKKSLMITKGGMFKVCAGSFGNENLSGCIQVLVYDKSTNNGVITLLYRRGITKHDTRDAFKPNNSIRRDEAAKMLIAAIPYLKGGNQVKPTNNNCKFNDINEARTDLQWSVRESCKLGIFNGSNKLFKPKDSITNAQLLTVIGRMVYGKLDESGDSYATVYYNRLRADGYLSNVKIPKTDWDYPAKRGTVAKLIAAIM